jgi:phosphatidylethanolamine/phosphatidyl-N-methylethanolamine N-methyltransferase
MSNLESISSEDPNHYLEIFYKEYYGKIHRSETLSFGNRYMHKSLESARSKSNFPITLELGCGGFEHLPYVLHHFERYFATDIRTPSEVTMSRLHNLSQSRNIEFLRLDAHAALDKFGSESVDRILSGCLLMHLDDPYSALISWQKMLKPKGVIDLMVPCDPGVALRLIRRMITERNASKFGVSKDMHRFINAIDHVSSFERLRNISLKAIRPGYELSINYHPFPFIQSWNTNVYSRFTIQRID